MGSEPARIVSREMPGEGRVPSRDDPVGSTKACPPVRRTPSLREFCHRVEPSDPSIPVPDVPERSENCDLSSAGILKLWRECMDGCGKKVDIGRRWFLSGAGAAAAGAVATAVAPEKAAAAANPQGRASYPSNRLAALGDLKPNEPLSVAYPDDDAPGVLIKLGTPVPGGVGPDGDVVGFSTVCPHKGFPLGYRAEDKTLNCPGHYSVFDCENGGQQTWGHATQNLPQYRLRVDQAGGIFAEGVDELLYGRLSNVLGS